MNYKNREVTKITYQMSKSRGNYQIPIESPRSFFLVIPACLKRESISFLVISAPVLACRGAGIQNVLKKLDSRLHGNDVKSKEDERPLF